MEIIRLLRNGDIDVVVGINLLREGLDLPEVSLVAIFDADREGFLRSTRSLIQTIGRAARNINGTVILYADQITNSMKQAIDETQRRRMIQKEFNEKNNITPKTIIKSIVDVLESNAKVSEEAIDPLEDNKIISLQSEKIVSMKELSKAINKLENKMRDLAKKLEFEEAAKIRDQITFLKKKIIKI